MIALAGLLLAALQASSSGQSAAPSDSAAPAKFYRGMAPVTATLTTNIRRLKGDKSDKDGNAPWRSATFTYTVDGDAPVTVPVRVRTRGIWRLKNCEFPPVRLNFSGSATKHTLLHGVDRPKLVSFCKDDDLYEQYVLREFQAYRVYHVLTPASHAVRLLRMTYADSASGKAVATRYAFFEEDPAAMAARLGGKLAKLTGAMPDDFDPMHSAVVGLFQYMIGNTDFALGALHNSELFAAPNGDYWPIVYDFDFSGAVDAKYATVDPRLHATSVRERIYRGYCVPLDTYPRVISLFNEKKGAIYALYRDSIGVLMRPTDVRDALEYYDQFYKTINDPAQARQNIINACLGTKPK